MPAKRLATKTPAGATSGGAASASSAGSNPKPASENTRNMQSLMLMTLKRSVQDPQVSRDRQQLLQMYQELPRFSQEKQELLAMWAKDKSCSWVNEYRVARSTQHSKEGSVPQGFGAKLDLAKLLHQDVESDVFNTILEGMPCDDDWGKQDPLEAGYARAGLKRYKLAKTELDKVSYKGSYQEDIVKHTSKETKEKLTGMKEALTAGEVAIKVENPSKLTMQEEMKVLMSGNTKLGALHTSIKKDAATLKAKGTEECMQKHGEVIAISQHLNEICEKIMDVLAEAGEVDCENMQAVQATTKKILGVKSEAEHHHDAAKTKRTSIRKFLSAMSS